MLLGVIPGNHQCPREPIEAACAPRFRRLDGARSGLSTPMGGLVENAAHPLGARHAGSPGHVADSLMEFARHSYPQQRRFASRRSGWTTSTADLLNSRVDVSFVDHASLAVAQFFVIGHIRPETVGPTLLDALSVETLGYPIATVLAEKLSTAVQLG